jgi:hypothetical protein
MATNGQFDTEAAAAPAPVGPLTRVTDVTTLPTPNEDIQIEFTSAISGVTVWMSYNEITDDDQRDAILARAGNFQAVIEAFQTALGTYNTAVQALSLPHTLEDWKTVSSGFVELARDYGFYNA